uniref:RRM domain-containing protein n=1 Tax=Pyrodinium bahamense TaxID=73915 RepID=A0A7S0BC17_9DINO|mmetsp:Transcript_9275/g.26025  ORF Transcript_9275/g.26025 Transcript_9275/m.26025 type:complete len:600 (+) Transcript_9275:91-1890(+)|eukprot:CAMPEP_0179019816 /NCGR_PEP_ID=MMETSP0796-20121207/5064_1 /TAXON_ID=73915 /ORGANISM="Pyrodinium bahamense, Strain pbaha01" /LENGTH=599 /DNA_ID=CAMNT_0020715617 /DNA_START=76 /DNA_END=1875 /DNA_ORIENTATION=-
MVKAGNATTSAGCAAGLDQSPAKKGNGRQHEDLQEKYHCLETMPLDEVTTMMIRNVPRKYSEEALMYELQVCVSPGSYNFVYLPWDARRSSNVGYAFVNFLDASTAQMFCQRLDGKPWRLVQCPKEIRIVPAHVQGIALNLVHYIGSSVIENCHAHAPMVVHNGKRISFKEAVDMYCTPELIQRHCKSVEAFQAKMDGAKKKLQAEELRTPLSFPGAGSAGSSTDRFRDSEESRHLRGFRSAGTMGSADARFTGSEEPRPPRVFCKSTGTMGSTDTRFPDAEEFLPQWNFKSTGTVDTRWSDHEAGLHSLGWQSQARSDSDFSEGADAVFESEGSRVFSYCDYSERSAAGRGIQPAVAQQVAGDQAFAYNGHAEMSVPAQNAQPPIHQQFARDQAFPHAGHFARSAPVQQFQPTAPQQAARDQAFLYRDCSEKGAAGRSVHPNVQQQVAGNQAFLRGSHSEKGVPGRSAQPDLHERAVRVEALLRECRSERSAPGQSFQPATQQQAAGDQAFQYNRFEKSIPGQSARPAINPQAAGNQGSTPRSRQSTIGQSVPAANWVSDPKRTPHASIDKVLGSRSYQAAWAKLNEQLMAFEATQHQ